MASGTFPCIKPLLFLFFSVIYGLAADHGGGGGRPMELWCVAKNNAEDTALQSALDWACGAGGANCGSIQKGGPCYDASDLQRTASFAFNDYFLKHGLTEDSCNFNNTAAITSLNPSHSDCKFPSSQSSTGNGNVDGNFNGGPSSMGSDNVDLDSGISVTHGCRWGIAVHLLLIVILLWKQ